MPPRLALPLRADPIRFVAQRPTPFFPLTRYRCLHISAVDEKATLREAVAQDHAELKHYYDQYKASTTDEGRIKWGNAFVWEITRHALGEELVMFPAIEHHLGEQGRQWVEEDRKDTQHFKESVYGFDNMSVANPHREPLLDIIWKDFHYHARKEEELHLPTLEKVLGQEKSHQLAKSFERTKRFTATRAHPGAPNKPPPFTTAAALMAAPIDKIRDIFRSWPEEDEDTNHRRL